GLPDRKPTRFLIEIPAPVRRFWQASGGRPFGGITKDDDRRSHDCLFQAAVIVRWRYARHLSKRRAERACLAEADCQPDIGDRWRRVGEQHLGALDTAVGVISVRRDAERLFESPAEIPRAQVNKLGEHRERYSLGEVLLDVRADKPLLPTGKPATCE